MTQRAEILRGRILSLLDDSIEGWKRLERDAGPNADVAVDSIITEMQRLRELVAHGKSTDCSCGCV